MYLVILLRQRLLWRKSLRQRGVPAYGEIKTDGEFVFSYKMDADDIVYGLESPTEGSIKEDTVTSATVLTNPTTQRANTLFTGLIILSLSLGKRLSACFWIIRESWSLISAIPDRMN